MLPQVVIVGAGPAGLINAIVSIKKGNPTLIIEKRSEHAATRKNTILLGTNATSILIEHGIYDYLIKENLIFPPSDGVLTVRLGDLEKAMKNCIFSLTNQKVIHYDSEVESISDHILVRTKEKTLLLYPDILVIADGAHSPTALLLNITRCPILPSLHVATAIFRDNRSIIYNFFCCHYHRIHFWYEKIFHKEKLENSRRKIRGALTLQTPGQNYVGYTLRENKQLKKWAHLSFFFCKEHAFTHPQRKKIKWLPLEELNETLINVDKADKACGTIGNTLFFLVGDALATFDPVSAQGCQTALKFSKNFSKILEGWNKGIEKNDLLVFYELKAAIATSINHKYSCSLRKTLLNEREDG